MTCPFRWPAKRGLVPNSEKPAFSGGFSVFTAFATEACSHENQPGKFPSSSCSYETCLKRTLQPQDDMTRKGRQGLRCSWQSLAVQP